MQVSEVFINLYATCETPPEMEAVKAAIVEEIKKLSLVGGVLEGKMVVTLPSPSDPQDREVLQIHLPDPR